MHSSNVVKAFYVFLSHTFLIILTTVFSVSYAQEVKNSTTKPGWQASLKRMYLFTDINDEKDHHYEYTAEGKFSIRSLTDNNIVFTGENINKNDPAAHLTSRSIFVIDPLKKSEAGKKESTVATVAPKAEPEIYDKDFFVYPNPVVASQREITLDMNDFENGKQIEMSLVDEQGRILNQQSFTLLDKKQAVAIPHLSSGMYFIKISEKDKQYNKKLMVK